MRIILIIGLILSFFSILSGYFGFHHWYFIAVIGVWLVFDCLHSRYNKKTTLQFLFHDKYLFIKAYLLMLALSFSIEGLGRYILKVWDYPLLNEPVKEIILILFYPFILFSFREMYGWLKNISKNWAFVTSMFLGIIIWEIPNLFSHDWIYHLDFFPYNIFGLNIIAILGWSFLIFFPDFGYREYLIKDRGNK